VVGRRAETSWFSVTAILRSKAPSSARRRPIILDWFHLSMRLRHIERAFEGVRQFETDLKFCRLTSAYFHAPRLRYVSGQR
jgi:hypothetical protein